MGEEMRSNREGLERVMNRLSPRSVLANPTLDAFAIPEEGSHRITALNDTPPDPIGGDSIARSSTSGLISGRDPFNPDVAFDVPQTSLTAKGLSKATIEARSGEDENLKNSRPNHGHGRIKSCTQCRLHKVLSHFLSSSEVRLTRLSDEV